MIKAVFVGDVLIKQNNRLTFSDDLKKIIENADIKCCNFEGPMKRERNNPIRKMGPNIFQHNESNEVLKTLGFNVFCLANNHICDYGVEAMNNTVDLLGRDNTIGCGQNIDEIYKPYILEKSNLKIGILNIAEKQFGSSELEGKAGYAWAFHSNVFHKIKSLKNDCDFVVVVAHAGLEDINLPLPEWREFYKRLIDEGVDVVVGHHPHVVQGCEKYKNGFIFYSLGNFIWQNESYKKKDTVMLELTFLPCHCINYEMHYVTVNENVIEEVDRNTCYDDFKYCTELMKNPRTYIDRINYLCKNAYMQDYKRFYYAALGFSGSNKFVDRVKDAIKLVLRGNKQNEVVLWHNISIETHIWAVQRALENLSDEDE